MFAYALIFKYARTNYALKKEKKKRFSFIHKACENAIDITFVLLFKQRKRKLSMIKHLK